MTARDTPKPGKRMADGEWKGAAPANEVPPQAEDWGQSIADSLNRAALAMHRRGSDLSESVADRRDAAETHEASLSEEKFEVQISDVEIADDSDDDFEQQTEDASDLLPFALAEQDLIALLGRTIRKRMTNSEPDQLRRIAAFLYALERLPYTTPGLALDLAIMNRVNGNLSYVSVELDEQSFRLSTGGSEYSPGIGSDTYSNTSFQIEVGGFREGATEDFEEWLDAFIGADGTITVGGDDEVDLTEEASDDGWSRLARYWEHQ